MTDNGNETRKVSELVWREDLYPRFEPDPATIQRYADDLELLPPVEINQHNELIDGYHRWTAHKKMQAESIAVVVTQTQGDRDLARLAMRRNRNHGLFIPNDQKKAWLMKWYTGLNGTEKAELADVMGVSERTVSRWTARKDKDLKDERNRKMAEMWLACYTEEEIAEAVGVTQKTVHELVNQESYITDNWQKGIIFSEYKDPDWTPPLYDVWKQQNKSNSTGHFGNSEASFLDRLLYLYTHPFSIIVDPFSGGGSTIDVCKKRLRRYWASDRLPIPERRDIRQWDILQGPPPLHQRWPKVSLLYLDPPYWKQAEGQYSKDADDLANMDLDTFYQKLTGFVSACAGKMQSGSHIALLIQPTQWNAPGRQVVDHVVDLILRLQDAPLKYVRRIVCPYESQQCTAQQVDWAKANRDVLVISRELIIWSVA